MKTYTFQVSCSFDVQYSFSEAEVEQDPDGKEGSVMPTAAAFSALCGELEESLGERFPVSGLQVDADSDQLLGVEVDSR